MIYISEYESDNHREYEYKYHNKYGYHDYEQDDYYKNKDLGNIDVINGENKLERYIYVRSKYIVKKSRACKVTKEKVVKTM